MTDASEALRRHAGTRARTRLYRGGRLVLEDFPPAEISDHLAEPDAVVWLDLCEPDESELHLIIEEFGLHELAVEDAMSGHQRPKVDRYPTHLFLTIYAMDTDESLRVCTREISVFVMSQALVTVRKSARFDVVPVCARWDTGQDGLASQGVPFLLHGLLDVVVDGYASALQGLDDAVDDLEDVLFQGAKAQIERVERYSYELRKDLMQVRRIVVPMREVMADLTRRDSTVLTEEMVPYYQDVYDHMLRAVDWADTLRDLVNSMLETNMMLQANRMNLVMKKVTSWAAIIAVPTAITGFFGQNLPFPGFQRSSGLALSTTLIVGLAVLLYVAFKKWEWL